MKSINGQAQELTSVLLAATGWRRQLHSLPVLLACPNRLHFRQYECYLHICSHYPALLAACSAGTASLPPAGWPPAGVLCRPCKTLPAFPSEQGRSAIR